MKIFLILISLFFLSNFQCNESDSLTKKKEDEIFVYQYEKKDSEAANDIKTVLNKNYQKVCADLDYMYTYKIQVKIYPDQQIYDESLIDRALIGSPAYSGSRKMHLVSPKSPIKIPGIPYEDRLLMAVHEFVHLMVDEINNGLPVWLDEGIACYEGSSNMYEYFCRLYMPELPFVPLNDLEENYYKISGADLYSYSAVRFIIEKYGFNKLNHLIKNPENFEKILSVTKDQFNKEWYSFIYKTWC